MSKEIEEVHDLIKITNDIGDHGSNNAHLMGLVGALRSGLGKLLSLFEVKVPSVVVPKVEEVIVPKKEEIVVPKKEEIVLPVEPKVKEVKEVKEVKVDKGVIKHAHKISGTLSKQSKPHRQTHSH